MSDNIIFDEEYTVICLTSFDNTYYERVFKDESSVQSFINEIKSHDSSVGRIFVSSRVTSYGLVEVL